MKSIKRVCNLFVGILLGLGMFVSLCGCEDNIVQVTFVQEGVSNKVISVEKGAVLSGAPTPVQATDKTLTTEWNVPDGFVVNEETTITATTFTKGSQFIEYTYNGKSCYIYGGCTSDSEKVIIPQYYKGGEVKIVQEEAFANNMTVKEVILPEGLTDIRNSAFRYAKNLKKINIPSTLEYARYAIFNSAGLEGDDLVIPEKVTAVETRAFAGAKYKTLHLGGNVESVKDFSFYGRTLETIVWGASLTSVSEVAFYQQPVNEIFYMSDQTDWENIVFNEYDYDRAPSGKADPIYSATNYLLPNATVYFAGEWEYVDGVPTPIKD